MAESFIELRDKVLNWSNRDLDVFGTTDDAANLRLNDFMIYAADKAYRKLRIPSFENTATYDSSNLTAIDIENNRLPVPPDLTEFIHIRIVDAYGTGNSIVLNEKADTRTFHDFISEKYDVQYTWTRQGRYILLPPNPGVVNTNTYEIFYYGRLPGLGTFYDISYRNWVLGVNTVFASDGETVVPYVDQDETAYDALVVAGSTTSTEVFNWFVHENERIILFGALAEMFAYLGEDDMVGKYAGMFQGEIDELNQEETMRHASGGNVRMNFNGRGLI